MPGTLLTGSVVTDVPSGGRDEFAVFFTDTWPDLVAFCHASTSSGHLAEEITQEALTRVYTRYASLREPRPYAFRVAANLVRRAWRESQRSELLEPQALPGGSAAAPCTDTLDAVRRLPSRLSSVVLLHYYADLPVEAVARLLHRPTGTIKRRLHEARALLAVALQEDLS